MIRNMTILGGILLVAAQSVAAQTSPQPSWPADLKAAVQGKWFAERNLEEVEVVGNDVILRKHAQFRTLYSDLPIGFVVAKLGSEDVNRRTSPYHRFINSQCADVSTNRAMSPCIIGLNMGRPMSDGPFKMNMTVRDRYWKQDGLTEFGRTHRARAPGS